MVHAVMEEADRREFLTHLIEMVEIYEEEQPNGQWLKSITFKLPIIPHDMEISLDNGSQVETVCLLTRESTMHVRLLKTMPERDPLDPMKV